MCWPRQRLHPHQAWANLFVFPRPLTSCLKPRLVPQPAYNAPTRRAVPNMMELCRTPIIGWMYHQSNYFYSWSYNNWKEHLDTHEQQSWLVCARSDIRFPEHIMPQNPCVLQTGSDLAMSGSSCCSTDLEFEENLSSEDSSDAVCRLCYTIHKMNGWMSWSTWWVKRNTSRNDDAGMLMKIGPLWSSWNTRTKINSLGRYEWLFCLLRGKGYLQHNSNYNFLISTIRAAFMMYAERDSFDAFH